MGTRPWQFPISIVTRPHRRRRTEADAEMGIRFSARQLRLRTADGRRRPGVRRRRHRLRVRARRDERLHPLVVPRRRRRANRRQHRQRKRGASVSRLLRRREGERVRGRRRHRCRGLAGSSRHASRGAGHRRAGARRWPPLRPPVIARGIGRGQPELSVLHVSRRRDVLRRRHGKAPLDVVHDPGAGRGPEEDLERHAALGTGGCRRLVGAVDRSQAPRGVCRHRQWIHAAGSAGIRRRDRIRSRQRQAPVDETGHGQRRVRARLPRQIPSAGADRQQVGNVSRRSRSRHGLRQRADSSHAGQRAVADRHRSEGRPCLGARPGQGRRGRVEPSGRTRSRQRRRRHHVGVGGRRPPRVLSDHACEPAARRRRPAATGRRRGVASRSAGRRRRAGDGDPGCPVRRLEHRDGVRLLDGRRQGAVAVRHGAGVPDGERCRRQRRGHQRRRSRGREPNAVRAVGLFRARQRRPRQCPARLRRAVRKSRRTRRCAFRSVRTRAVTASWSAPPASASRSSRRSCR